MDTDNDLPVVRFRLNMDRILGVIKLSFSDVSVLRGIEPFQTDGVRADILRTTVVFLHATFEDFLRTIARQRIAIVKSQEVLDKIPLVGVSKSGRAEKFYLGALNAHRGKTVDQLIRESVENYLDETSFASIRAIDEVLRQAGLDTAPFKFLYADIDQMVQRRHRIVHEADLPSPKDAVAGPWTIEDYFSLCIWLLVVPTFYSQLRLSIDPADEVQRWYVASRIKAIEFAREARAETIALLNQPHPEVEALRLGLLKASERLKELLALLARPSAEEMFLIWKKAKSSDDDTTDEQARAKIISWRDTGQ
ncbi:MAG: HEPN domain-containing protein [Terriglobia bacterium]|jgi:hypothetical protein